MSNTPKITFVLPTFFLEGGITRADVNAERRDHWTPLHLASYSGKLDIARLLLDQGANASATDTILRTPLHLVAVGIYESQEDGVRVAQLLLDHGADVNAFDLNRDTALHAATSSGRHEIARVLLGHATVKNDQGQKSSHLGLEGKHSPKN